MKILQSFAQGAFYHCKLSISIFLSLLVIISLPSLDAAFAEGEADETGSASLVVTVSDEDGAPIEGAKITLYSFKTTMDHTGSWSGRGTGEAKGPTPADGSVTIEGLKPGTYVLKVQADGYMSGKLTDIVLIDGDEKQVEIRLPQGEQPISGQVVDDEGQPIPDTSVSFYISKKGFFFRDYIYHHDSDKEGRFQCEGLEAGVYNIDFRKEGFLKKELQKIPAGSTDLKVVLERGCALSGTILTTEGTVPGERVRIRLARPRRSGSKNVELDESGHYRLEAVEPGTISLSAETESLTSAKIKKVKLKIGQELEGINFVLYPGLSISGRVSSSADGAPLAGVSVSAKDKKQNIRRRDKTGDDGEYSISRLYPGLYIVVPEVGSWRNRSKIEQKVELEPGESKRDVDFNVELPPKITISGRVVTESGSPAPRAQINVVTFRKKDSERGRHSSMFPLTHSDDDGEFAIQINRFPKVIVFARDEDHAWSQGQPILTDNHTAEYEVTITLERGMAIAGVVKDQLLQPLKGATISLFSGRRTFERNKIWRPIAEASTDEEGGYQFEHVSLGQNTLVASMEGFSRESQLIACGPGSPEHGYDFVLNPGAKIYGYVKDKSGRPVAKARVHCTGETAPGYAIWKSNLKTDTTGYFEYGNLAQGSYKLWVRHPDFCDVRKEDVYPADKPLSITLKKGQKLSGRVLSADTNEPVKDYEITMEKKEGPGEWKRVFYPRPLVRYEAGGEFVVEHLEEGKYKVAVEADGYASAKAGPLTIPLKKKSKPLVIVLKKGYTVGGTVRAKDTGKPVERVKVYVLDPEQPPQNLDDRILGYDWTSSVGKFRVSGLGKGDWSLLTNKRGYSHYQMEHLPPGDNPSAQALEINLETDPDELSPDEWRMSGLGFSMEPDKEDKKVLIKKVYEGSAAQKVGLRPGDHLVAINDEDVSAPLHVIYILRSPGYEVTLKVTREGEESPLEMKIEKGKGYDPLLW